MKIPSKSSLITIAASQFVLMALAFAPVSGACTPTPCIEASPNPVVVGTNVILGTTLLDWDAGLTAEPARVTVEVDGQETTVSNSPQGQVSRNIGKGRVYIFRLRNSVAVLDSVRVTTSSRSVTKKNVLKDPKRRPYTPAPMRVFYERFGTFLKFSMETDEDRDLYMVLATNESTDCEVAGLDVVGTMGSLERKKEHNAELHGLEPSTEYFFLIQMRTADGDLLCRTGFVRTLRRHTTVFLEDFFVTDDSDDLSGGDLTLGLFLNPNYGPNWTRNNDGTLNLGDAWTRVPESGDLNIDTDTGYSFDPNVALHIDDVETADFNLTMFDNDENTSFPVITLATCGTGVEALQGGGETDCGDWGGKTISLDFSPTGPGSEEVTRSFTLEQTEGSLTFRASGHFTVTYRADP